MKDIIIKTIRRMERSERFNFIVFIVSLLPFGASLLALYGKAVLAHYELSRGFKEILTLTTAIYIAVTVIMLLAFCVHWSIDRSRAARVVVILFALTCIPPAIHYTWSTGSAEFLSLNGSLSRKIELFLFALAPVACSLMILGALYRLVGDDDTTAPGELTRAPRNDGPSASPVQQSDRLPRTFLVRFRPQSAGY